MTDHVVLVPDETGVMHRVMVPDTPEDSQPAREKVPGEDMLHTIGVALSSLPRGVMHLLNAFGTGSKEMLQGALSLEPPNGPVPQNIRETAEAGEKRAGSIRKFGVAPEPGSAIENIVNAFGESAPTAALAGPLGPETSVLRAATTAGLSGAGGELATQRFGESPITRIVGALAGGGVPTAQKLLLQPGNARKLATKALSDMTEDPEGAFTTQNLKENKELAIPQTVAQSTGTKAPSLQNLETAVVQGSEAPKTKAILSAQPAAYQQKVKEAVAGLPGAQTSEGAVAQEVQQGLSARIKAGYAKANQAYRDTLGGASEELSQEQVGGFADTLKAVVQREGKNTDAGRLATNVLKQIEVEAPSESETLLGELENLPGKPTGEPAAVPLASAENAPLYESRASVLKQTVNDAMDSFPKSANVKPGKLNAIMGSIREAMNSTFEEGAPELRAAMRAHEDVIRSEVNPLREGPVGRVAGSGSMLGKPASQKLFAVLDRGTTPGGNSDILTLARELNKVDPQAFPNAVKTNLATKIAQASETKGGELDPKFLRSFYNSIAGTDNQVQGLREQFVGMEQARGLPAGSISRGMMKLVDAIGRTAKSAPEAANLTVAEANRIAGSNAISNIFRTVGFMAGGKFIGQRIEDAYRANAFKSLDRLTSSPEGLKLLQTLATNDPMGKVGQQAVISFLAGAEGPKSGVPQ